MKTGFGLNGRQTKSCKFVVWALKISVFREFCETVEITDVDGWIRTVEEAEEMDDEFEDDWDNEEEAE